MRRRREPLTKTDAWRAWKAEVEKQLILRGWDRQNLADAIGVSRIYVANTICGSVRSVKNVNRISEALGIRPFKVEAEEVDA